jgi:hypothetical protein
MSRKVDEIEFSLQKSQKKTTLNDDLGKKLTEMEGRMKQMDNKIYENHSEQVDKCDELKS